MLRKLGSQEVETLEDWDARMLGCRLRLLGKEKKPKDGERKP